MTPPGTSTSGHTPTPWEYDGEYIWADAIKGYVANPSTEDMRDWGVIDANAAFIVQAVNSFDALVAACEEFCRKVEAGEARSVKSYAQMKAALRLARGDQP